MGVKELSMALWRAVRDPVVPAPLPPMTYDRFLAVLRATPRTWRITEKGWIRSEDGGCPITKGCEQVTGRWYSAEEWGQAARAMGLPRVIGQKILPAADNAEHHVPTVRRDLLVATGLLVDPLDAGLAALAASAQPEPEAEEREPAAV